MAKTTSASSPEPKPSKGYGAKKVGRGWTVVPSGLDPANPHKSINGKVFAYAPSKSRYDYFHVAEQHPKTGEVIFGGPVPSHVRKHVEGIYNDRKKK
jgi:hypothetical protein